MLHKFQVKDLNAQINGQNFIKDINLSLKTGDVLIVFGPNGAGKSSLLKSLMGHYNYPITTGKILLDNKDITDLPTDEKARLGLFYFNQNPMELEGVQMLEFFKLMTKHQNQSFIDFFKKINNSMKEVGLKNELLKASVNVGMSGGEKKRNEILQSKILNPKIVLIDEIDSGLDLDAIKMVTDYINQNKSKWITIIVSHHLDFLKKIKHNKSIVLIDGEIVAKNQKDIINYINNNGYKSFFKKQQSKTLPIACCNK